MSMGKNISGALSYNEQKIRQGTAELIMASHFGRDINEMGFSEKVLRFEKLNQFNTKTKTNTLHLSLNFSPYDELSDEKLQQIAYDYMDRIGFASQPFLVYKHSDTAHPHLHIVTSTIQSNGKPIYLHNLGKRKSEPARKAIEIEYGLVKAEGRKLATDLPDTNNISNVISRVIAQYKFTSLEELNAVLRIYNITADCGATGSFRNKVGGLVFCRIDENGYKIGKSVKASSIYKKPTLKALVGIFEKNQISKLLSLKKVQASVLQVLERAHSTHTFLQKLQACNIKCSIKCGIDGMIHSISFVHISTKTIYSNEELGISISYLLNKLNFRQTIESSYNNHSVVDELTTTNSDHTLSHLSSFLIKTLFSSDQYQPDISPDFFKKKRKKKKR